jgi:SAM-dependent methyltransferase
VKLDIGGGRAPAPGHVNLDVVHGEGQFHRRVQDGIPLPDASVESARCSHLMEHIPSTDRIAVFNEVRRVLRPGGTFEVVVPLATPNAAGRWYGAIADPTHVSLWVEQSFWYFTGRMVANADYGIALWEPVEWTTREWDWGTEGRCVLRKPT